MAGSGIRVFASGEILTAAQVNGYLMDQAVLRFADAATRDASFGGAGQPVLTEGRICYLDDVNLIQFYDGSSWQSSDQFTVADGSITEAKLADNSVTSAKIAPGTVIAADIAAGSITNTEVSASAAIALSKLATGTQGTVVLHNSSGVPTATAISGDIAVTNAGVTSISSGVIVNADINASAGIALSKLATSTAGNIIVYNSSGVPTAVAETGDVTISDTGVTSIASGVIVNADINASAAIADTKLATISTAGKVSNSATTATDANTNSAIIARDASGNFSAGTANLLSASVSGRFDGTILREAVADTSVSASVVTANYSTGTIFYIGTAPSSNFTVNLTNAPTDNGKAITIVLFVTQGSTGYYPNVVQVAGVGQTIKWANGAAPVPTSSAGKIDTFSFTFIRRSSAWTVFGSSNLGY